MSGNLFIGDTEISVSETAGQVLIPVVRTGDTSQAVTIQYGVTASGATAGDDYIGPVMGSIVLPAGATQINIPVTILNDTLSESTETFVVSLADVSSGTLLAPRTSRVSILDDENPVLDPPEPPLVSNFNVSTETVIGGLDGPLDIAFVEGSSVAYVAEKAGVIKVIDTATGTQLSTFIDISDKVNNNSDRGLLHIALDPDFNNGRPYVYAFYVVDPPETAGLTGAAGPDGEGNRFSYLVRFTADTANGSLTAVPGSEQIILGAAGQSLSDISGGGVVNSTSDLNQPESGRTPDGGYVQDYLKVDSRSHAGGGIAFGPDGALYVSVGDGVSFDFTDPRAVSVQDVRSLAGKILRIDPDTGLGLPDNPFVTPGADLSLNESKVYQLGLRNPFGLSFDNDGNLIITETGWFSYEEINSGGPGANFGWPFYEGADAGLLAPTPGYQNIPEAAAFYDAVNNGQIDITVPFRAFSHASGDPGFQIQAITGGDVDYTGNVYPDALQGTYFFNDFAQGELYAVSLNDPTNIQFLYKFPSGFGAADYTQGPDGYVYFADLITGQIGRLIITPKPATTSVFVVNGDATANATPNSWQLTAAAANQVGSVLSQQRVDLNAAFEISFTFNVGANDSGADGFAFVFENAAAGANAVGSVGGGLGAYGLANGLGIEFDIFNGSPGDIANDHTLIFNTATGVASTTAFDLGNIENGATHTSTINWNGNTLTYSVDGVTVATFTNNIVANFLGGSRFAHFGFTGATGGLTANQNIVVTSLTATAEDGSLLTLNGAANAAPVGVSDTYTATAGQTLTIAAGGVLANDTDANGDALTAQIVAGPTNGTLTLAANGSFTYTPTTGFTGTDSFQYRPFDGALAGAATTVTLNVVGSGSAAGFVVNGSATALATDNSWQLTTATANQVGSVLSQQRVNLNEAFNISFRFNVGASDAGADGFAFVFENAAAGANALGSAGGGLGAYGLANGLGIEFDIFSAGAGDIANDHTQIFNTATGVAATTAFDLGNLENGAFHTGNIQWNGTTLTYSVDGQTIANFSNNIVANFLGGSQFAYFGFTGATGGLTANQSVEITALSATAENGTLLTLGGTNVAPIGTADAYNAIAGQALTIAALQGVLANDTDANGDDLTAQLVTGPAHGTLALAANGSFTYTPTAGFTGADSFQYQPFDGELPGQATTVAITVGDSSTTATFMANGDASASAAAHTWQLTAPNALEVGSVFSQQRIDLNEVFDINFRFNVGASDAGADGIAFVFQNAAAGATAVGGVGGGLGAYGISNGLGIEFDTFNNGVGDIVNDHTQIFNTATSVAATTAFDLGNLENGAFHTANINWNGTTLSYSVDGNLISSLTTDIGANFLGGSDFAYFGFTGATGGLVADQNVEILSLVATTETGLNLIL